ncbi:MAG: nucleotidyltransferase domain-containing protein [Methanosarcinales archaeon]
MCKLCQECNIHDRKAREAIKQIIHQIINLKKIHKIILFGSFARGDYHQGSDIDLVIVGDFKERFFDRIGKILDLNDTDFDLEPLVYTPEEFDKMIKEKRLFLQEVMNDGIIVYKLPSD